MLNKVQRARDALARKRAEVVEAQEKLHDLVLECQGTYKSREVAEAAGLASQTVRNLWWKNGRDEMLDVSYGKDI